jgi:enoyl-CoA hydratase/carnithine racemase
MIAKSTKAENEGRIVTRRDGAIMLVGLDRPAKLNGFTPKMLVELAAAYTELERDDTIRCGILYAEGKNFTAGLDLPKVGPLITKGERLFAADAIDPLNNHPPFRSKPLIAAVQGICFTIGIELMLAADIVVAARDCRFSQLEVKRGIMATGGATIRMVERAGWGNAMRYLLTGDEFDAATAWRLGFVQEIVPPGEVMTRALALARDICAAAPLAVRATLANARAAVESGPVSAIAEFVATQRRLGSSADAREGVQSFIEKRAARFTGG